MLHSINLETNKAADSVHMRQSIYTRSYYMSLSPHCLPRPQDAAAGAAAVGTAAAPVGNRAAAVRCRTHCHYCDCIVAAAALPASPLSCPPENTKAHTTCYC